MQVPPLFCQLKKADWDTRRWTSSSKESRVEIPLVPRRFQLVTGRRWCGTAFGGYKKTGNGREWGEWGFHDFLEVKAVMGHG